MRPLTVKHQNLKKFINWAFEIWNGLIFKAPHGLLNSSFYLELTITRFRFQTFFFVQKFLHTCRDSTLEGEVSTPIIIEAWRTGSRISTRPKWRLKICTKLNYINSNHQKLYYFIQLDSYHSKLIYLHLMVWAFVKCNIIL